MSTEWAFQHVAGLIRDFSDREGWLPIRTVAANTRLTELSEVLQAIAWAVESGGLLHRPHADELLPGHIALPPRN